MSGKPLKFKKETKYPHKRSEGLTRRGAKRQERLMLGPKKRSKLPTLEELGIDDENLKDFQGDL